MKVNAYKVTHTCPDCKTEFQYSSSICGEGSAPKSGDYSICSECGAFMCFGEKQRARILTEDEIVRMDDDTRIAMIRIRNMIARDVARRVGK